MCLFLIESECLASATRSLLFFSDDAFASVNVFIRAAHASNKVPHTFTLFSYIICHFYNAIAANEATKKVAEK